MACADCAAAWAEAAHLKKAEALDSQIPDCGCEAESLRVPSGDPVRDDELVVRVITGPDGYDNGEILRGRLTALFSSGVSLIREGASEDEIRQTVAELTTGTADERHLVGAVIVKADLVRYLRPDRRCFCIFDTPQRGKERHADIMCPQPRQGSKTQDKKWQSDMRDALQKLFMPYLIEASTPEALIAQIRAAEDAKSATIGEAAEPVAKH